MFPLLLMPLLAYLVLGDETGVQSESESEYPYPQIVIMGQSGVGKSSLGNVLAGCPPNENCFFPLCAGSASCTNETSIAVADYLGPWATMTYGQVTLVDTSGFGDSSGDDTPLLTNMIEVLKNTLGDANLILLCQSGNTRFNPSTIQMILELESIFGRGRLWDNVLIEITKWAYDTKSIHDRELQGLTEESALKDINDNLIEISHLEHPLEGIFLDSYATYYPDDESQQTYFQSYAKQLWEIASSKPKFKFYTIEDMLGQLEECLDDKEVLENEIRWLNDVITENITKIFNQLNSNTATIEHNSDDVSFLNSKVVINEKNIADMNTYITQDISSRITQNEGLIQDMMIKVEELNVAPIGTITAWVNRPVADVEAADLPDGWVKCDGSTISHPSIWAGKLTPELNKGRMFLRGSEDKDMLALEEDQLQDHQHEDGGHSHAASSSASPHSHSYKDYYQTKTEEGDLHGNGYDIGQDTSTSRTTSDQTVVVTTTVEKQVSGLSGVTSAYRKGGETRPKNMGVIYIMRVW